MNRRLSAPLVISLVALFFSLSGVGLAAQHYLGPAHARALRTINVYGNLATLCGGTTTSLRKCQVNFSGALCPAGTVVTGGGWVGGKNGSALSDVKIQSDAPLDFNAWGVDMTNLSPLRESFRAVAVCSS